jgi:hypothetical protein
MTASFEFEISDPRMLSGPLQKQDAMERIIASAQFADAKRQTGAGV